MNPSIRNRLLSTTTLVLVVFLAVTGLALDSAYRNSVVSGVEEQLKLVVYAVMGAVDEDEGELYILTDTSEPRLSQPASGLYAQVRDEFGAEIWTSPSVTNDEIRLSQTPSEAGAFMFMTQDKHYLLSYTVIWEGADSERISFLAATDRLPVQRSINQFRTTLGGGFALAMVFFIVAQLLALRWGLSPLREMAHEVEELENGERHELSDGYPQELQGLAGNLGRFVAHEERSRTRYRNALDDLAHSLKTPLAVVRNSLLDPEPDRDLLTEQLSRMETTVAHQLTRASAQGPVVVGKPVNVAALVERLVQALNKAYMDRGVQAEAEMPEEFMVRGDEADFLEIFGNLIENAYKYTNSKVWITGEIVDQGMRLSISDDGPGIPESERHEVLHRGKRLDELKPGQGIGLAVVGELVELYGGELTISESAAGGAAVTVQLPI